MKINKEIAHASGISGTVLVPLILLHLLGENGVVIMATEIIIRGAALLAALLGSVLVFRTLQDMRWIDLCKHQIRGVWERRRRS